MDLKDKINRDFLTAFKAKDFNKKNFLGLIKSEIQTEATRGIDMTDDKIVGILKTMVKSLKQINTTESAIELLYIDEYLPKLMSEELITVTVTDLISNGADTIGKIMGAFNSQFKGKADNSIVSKIANKLLNKR